MYITKLKIKNFRAIKDLEISLNEGLNVIIGENNSGKTAVIDLLRLIFDKGNYPSNVYWKKSDFRVDLNSNELKSIEFEIELNPNDEEKFKFNDLHIFEPDENDKEKGKEYLKISGKISYDETNPKHKIKREFWGGKDIENKIPIEIWESLNYIYLNPLRDVNRDLKPNNSNLLAKLLLNIVETNDKYNTKELSNEIKENFNDNDNLKELLKECEEIIREHLNGMNFINEYQDIDVNFSSFDFEDIVKKFILQIPINNNEETESYFNLYQNGLGYNNLIYAATIFGDIIQRNKIFKDNYNLLLIEEPEAHLHPQLENTFFKYLEKLGKNNNFQIITTSHSPNITSKTDLNNIIVMNHINNNIFAVSIKDMDLKEDDKIFLEKFLDVIKSQLFFSKGVILVEGITEALLLPIFADKMGEDFNLEKNGIEVVVTGTSFQRYAGLFNSENKSKRLNFKCAVITDSDHDKGKQSETRIENLKNESKYNFNTFIGDITFENELFKNNVDNDIIITVFKKIHPKTLKNKDDEENFGSKELIEKLKSNNSKSEFAYELAKHLNENPDNKFKIPDYITDAISFVVGKKYVDESNK